MTEPALTTLALAFAGGLLVGASYFAALWFSVRSLTGGSHRWPSFALGGVLRLAAMGGALALLLSLGVSATLILVGCLGFLVARLAATALGRPGKQMTARER
ncbi:MAG TPA: ATP synthase subunit I [Alphaproteobacteria bacterium]|nr:ATP synthase subunit I [Alphaproteobacteria bacterium]